MVVIVKPEAELRATREGLASASAADASPMADLLESEGAVLRPLFGANEQRMRAATEAASAESDQDVPDLSTYYRVDAPEERIDELAEKMRELEVVDAAYVKPLPQLPLRLNAMSPSVAEPPLRTPNFIDRQGYLEAAPEGVDARFAWGQPGGGGEDVRIIDIEGAWRFTHEDLTQNQGGVVGGTQIDDVGWRDHGTAVVGEFGGDRTPYGVVGICPEAHVQAISHANLGSAGAIRRAADLLRPGDILLLEMHQPGPRFNFEYRDDQRGYIAVEWWPDDFAAIRYATSRGIIVVEAAGNGAENLDDPIYDENPGNFPDWWRNPFRRGPLDSGAIVVGAGAPPPGTHGSDHGPDRSRLDFSNWGALVDAQGWGREVTTAGYGDLQGGANEDHWYTDEFAGTSSASPIVVGALGCLQGILKHRGAVPLDPVQARELLRSTGSPQQDAPSRPGTQRIGNRPDLRQLVPELGVPTLSTLRDLRFGNHETYERAVLDLDGAGPSGESPPPHTYSYQGGDWFVRVKLPTVEATEKTGGPGLGKAVASYHVVRSRVSDGLYVDFHLGGPAESVNVSALEGPARIVVDVTPGGTSTRRRPVVGDAAVVINPRNGVAVGPGAFRVSGYARPHEGSGAWRIKDTAGKILGHGTYTTSDWATTWGSFAFRAVYPASMSGRDGTLEVGGFSVMDGRFRGISVPLRFK